MNQVNIPLSATGRAIAEHLHRGCLVALADGVGAPISLASSLTEAAIAVGGVHLLLGWSFREPPFLDPRAFMSVRTTMAGRALSSGVAAGDIQYLPIRLSALPGLLHGPLRPDVLLLSAHRTDYGLTLGSEVSWLHAAAQAAPVILVELNEHLPNAADSTFGLLPTRSTIITEVEAPPVQVPLREPTAIEWEIGRRTAQLIPGGSTLQFAPGAIGSAVVRSVTKPVHVHTGAITDDVVTLSDRGLLVGEPRATYLLGSDRTYGWANDRNILGGVEDTHCQATLMMLQSFVAVNTAFQVDETGQVNIEGVNGRLIAGVGGQPDFALAGSLSPTGLSIIALPTENGGRSTLVPRLSFPTSTPRSDIDIIVTEKGVVDLRGRSDQQRAFAIQNIWG